MQNALWLLSLSSPDTWDRVTKAGGCDTRAAGSRSFTAIYISLVSLLGLYRVGFLTQRSKGRSDNSDVDHLAWRSRAIYPIRSTNTPMSRRSEKIISNWEEVCKGIHIIGIFCSHKQARPEVRHDLLRAGCSFWHIVFLLLFLVTFSLECYVYLGCQRWTFWSSQVPHLRTYFTPDMEFAKKDSATAFFEPNKSCHKCVLMVWNWIKPMRSTCFSRFTLFNSTFLCIYCINFRVVLWKITAPRIKFRDHRSREIPCLLWTDSWQAHHGRPISPFS